VICVLLIQLGVWMFVDLWFVLVDGCDMCAADTAWYYVEALYRRLKTTGWLAPFARHDYCVSWVALLEAVN
jgi:hypothetical protein